MRTARSLGFLALPAIAAWPLAARAADPGVKPANPDSVQMWAFAPDAAIIVRQAA